MGRIRAPLCRPAGRIRLRLQNPLQAGTRRSRVYRGRVAKRSKTRPVPPGAAEAGPAEGPVDDAGSLVTVVGEQNASGWPQGIVAVVAVYALVRLGGLLVRFLRSGERPPGRPRG